jgi:hypothetical protein
VPRQIPPIPATVTGDLRIWLEQLRTTLSNEVRISAFSGDNPNTSGVTAGPGDILVNVNPSASTITRMFISRTTRSYQTNEWSGFGAK